MNFLKRLFGKKPAPAPGPPKPEHAVLVRFSYGSTDLSDLNALEDRIEASLGGQALGQLDGNEMAADGSEGTLFLYGPDADALFAAIRPELEKTGFLKGAVATLRYGPPGEGVREAEIPL